jgi:hypothetical protein
MSDLREFNIVPSEDIILYVNSLEAREKLNNHLKHLQEDDRRLLLNSFRLNSVLQWGKTVALFAAAIVIYFCSPKIEIEFVARQVTKE